MRRTLAILRYRLAVLRWAFIDEPFLLRHSAANREVLTQRWMDRQPQPEQFGLGPNDRWNDGPGMGAT